MLKSKGSLLAFSTLVFVVGFWLGNVFQPWSGLHAQSDKRVFEIRTYTAAEGKLDALHARFRDHTMRIFKNHGMTSIGYWSPEDAPLKQNTLIYILAHPSREAAAKNWQAFQNDPEWQKARAESETQGRLTSKVESVFADPTSYSPMK
jgi:NIPSNAP protein